MSQPGSTVLVAGGGLVGGSVALALAQVGHTVTLFERSALEVLEKPGIDARNTALGFGSRALLERLSLWKQLAKHCSRIERIHVSQAGAFGSARLSREAAGLPELGYLVPNHRLLQVLYDAVRSHPRITLREHCTIDSLDNTADSVTIGYRSGDNSPERISALLLIAADGARSRLRQLQNISVSTRDYGQTAVVCNVKSNDFEPGLAFERFTSQGPIGLLPLEQGWYAGIFCLPTNEATACMNLSDQAFLSFAQQRFGYRAGEFVECSLRQSWPLKLSRAERCVNDRCALMGNAAYTLHPIAGQGFNLALRDVMHLADLVGHEVDPGKATLLRQFEDDRKPDVDRIIEFTDGLIRLFGNPSRLMRHARGVSLFTIGQSAELQGWVSRRGLGVFRAASSERFNLSAAPE